MDCVLLCKRLSVRGSIKQSHAAVDDQEGTAGEREGTGEERGGAKRTL